MQWSRQAHVYSYDDAFVPQRDERDPSSSLVAASFSGRQIECVLSHTQIAHADPLTSGRSDRHVSNFRYNCRLFVAPRKVTDSKKLCGVAGLEPRTYATAKGMLPLKPEENRWRRASFTIGTSYGTTPKLGGPHCTGLLLQLVRYITLQMFVFTSVQRFQTVNRKFDAIGNFKRFLKCQS